MAVAVPALQLVQGGQDRGQGVVERPVDDDHRPAAASASALAVTPGAPGQQRAAWQLDQAVIGVLLFVPGLLHGHAGPGQQLRQLRFAVADHERGARLRRGGRRDGRAAPSA